jgi:hypothetical protein
MMVLGEMETLKSGRFEEASDAREVESTPR